MTSGSDRGRCALRPIQGRWYREWVRGILACTVCALALIGASSASAQSPSTLEGETLVSLFSKCNEGAGTGPPPSNPCTQNPAPPTVEATCDEAGDSTLTYDITASGPQNQGTTPVVPSAAAGPYNGSFVEWDGQDRRTGRGPGAQRPVDLLLGGADRVERFRHRPAAHLGRPVRDPGRNLAGGRHEDADDAGAAELRRLRRARERAGAESAVRRPGPPHRLRVDRRCEARLWGDDHHPRRPLPRRGNGGVRLRETFVRCCGSDGLGSVSADVGFLVEIFDSTQAAPTPLSKDDCKKGGWATLGMGFKNQGDCVSYFATNGKNGPAG